MKPSAQDARTAGKRVPFLHIMLIAGVAIAVIAALASRTALAEAGADGVTQSRSEKLLVPKAELATPDGRRAAEARMAAIAARLCRDFRDTRTVAHRETYAQCTQDALAGARSQIPLPPAYASSSGQSDQRHGVQEAAGRVAGK